MKLGALLAVLVAIAGVAVMGFVFLFQSSPYVTVAQASTTKGDNLRLAGKLVQGSLFSDVTAGEVRFDLVDSNGATAHVVYKGAMPANLATAQQVVAIGAFKDGKYQAHDLLLKCPSKYESK